MTPRSADQRRRPGFGAGIARWPYRVVAVDATTGPACSAPAQSFLDVGVELTCFADGTAALLCLSNEDPAAVLAPTEMRGVDFICFIETVIELSAVPILVGLTRDPSGQQRAYAALDLGARALVALPVGRDELSPLTQQFATRRPSSATAGAHQHITLDAQAHRVEVAGTAVNLSSIELATLRVLFDAAPNLVSKEELVEILSPERRLTVAYMTRVISRIRYKLGAAAPDQPHFIETVQSLGYRLRN